MQWPITCQGRSVLPEEVGWLREWIEQNPLWSRKQIARQLCLEWNWRDHRGRLKDFAARSFLLKLATRHLISLPALRTQHRTRRPVMEAPTELELPPQRPITQALSQLQPIHLELIRAGSEPSRRWAHYLHHYHYLGLRMVGENMGYLAQDRLGRDVAALLFGAPAWRCAARDRHLGWSDAERARQLCRVANNTRFLILPEVRVPHLASHILAAAARRIDSDWQAKYGHGLDWLETFVDVSRFAGVCYRAANWTFVGLTQGRTRQDRQRALSVPPKAIFLYRLGAHRRSSHP